MKEKQVYKKIWPLPVKNFKKIFLWHHAVHIMNLTVNRQVCVIKTVAYRDILRVFFKYLYSHRAIYTEI